MRRIGRRPFMLTGLVLAACGGKVLTGTPSSFDAGGEAEAPPEPPDAAKPPFSGFDSAPPPEPTSCIDKNPTATLRALTGLGQREPTLPRLYSFTTKAQADGLRRGDPLFSKTTSDTGHRGYLFDVLTARAGRGDKTAKELSGPRFEAGRFAWPFLAGTRVSPERYGDEILSFTFKTDALFVAFSMRAPGYRFFDVRGKSVPEATAMATPERLAAFLFLNDMNTVSDTLGNPQRCLLGTLNGSLVYREFYLGNLAMIEEWSLGTQAIVDRITAEVADLRSLARDLDCANNGRIGPNCDAVLQRWYAVGPNRSDQLLASMAFASPFGWNGWFPVDLTRLADDLDTLKFVPSPFVVTPP